MKFQETLLALSLLVIGLVSCQPAIAQGNNDYAPSSAPQLETPGSLPPPAAESAGVASGGQKRHHGKGHKGKGGGKAANPQKRQQMMARFDTNGDGMLDDTERAAAKAMRGQGKAGGGKRHGGKSANPADKAARKQKMMARFDTNGDGQLDATEKASLQAFREQRRQKRMQRQGGGAQ
jgi:hypothetical protein